MIVSSLFSIAFSLPICQEPATNIQGLYCLEVAGPDTFEKGCTVKSFYTSFKWFLEYIDTYEYVSEYVWLPFKRRYKFGPMVFVAPGSNYREIYPDQHFSIEEFSLTKDCIVAKNRTARYVDCSEKYLHLCLHSLEFEDDESQCDSDDHDEDVDECSPPSEFFGRESVLDGFRIPDTNGLNVYYLTEDTDSCSSCRMDSRNVPTADLILNFEMKRRRLFLIVYSPEGKDSILRSTQGFSIL